METAPTGSCVLMFSGGRDSTISAVRLSKKFRHLILVTILGEHLVGIEKVKKRISQLKKILPDDTEWLKIIQPKLKVSRSLYNTTCLPCQQAYACVGIAIARRRGIADLAMGYTGYQNSWPEQTPYATKRLRELLQGIGMRLHLPVSDVGSKEEAMNELTRMGLEAASFEQKCLKQSSNVDLDDKSLKPEIDRWVRGIAETVESDEALDFTIISHTTLDGKPVSAHSREE